MSLAGPEFEGAARETRFVTVENLSVDRLALEPDGLERTTVGSLPFVPTNVNPAQIFRARANGILGLRLERLEKTAGKDAVILWADLITAFRANGEEWLRATYHLQNRSLQFLPMDLPEGGELVSVRVAGEPTRADRGKVDGKPVLLVPLIQTDPGQLAYDVEIVVRRPAQGGAAARSGERLKRLRRELDDPEPIGISVEQTFWTVSLPKGFTLRDFDGNLQAVTQGEVLKEKWVSDLSELEALTRVGQVDDYGVSVQQDAVLNSEALSAKLEQKLGEIERFEQDGRDVDELRYKLKRQMVQITENRINMPVFDRQSGVLPQGAIAGVQRGGEDASVRWEYNGTQLMERNKQLKQSEEEQFERLQGQMRLNDNIAVGNGFFGSQALKEVQDEERQMPLAQQDAAINKLTDNRNDVEVESKLRDLNLSQIGQSAKPESGKGMKTVRPQAQAMVGNFIDLDADHEVTVQKKMAQKESAPGKAGADSFSGGAQSFSYSNARSSLSLSKGDGGKAVAAKEEAERMNRIPNLTRLPASPSALFSSRGISAGNGIQAPVQQALKPSGRRAVEVMFPLEGVEYRFRKLKSHAELSIEAAEVPRRDALRWGISLAVCLLVLVVVDRLMGKIRRRKVQVA